MIEIDIKIIIKTNNKNWYKDDNKNRCKNDDRDSK